MEMHGNTIFITGGTSGMAKGWLRHFISWETKSLSLDGAKITCRILCTTNPGMRYFVLDVRDPAAIRTVARKAVAEFPSLNCVFNNAGVQRRLELLRARRWMRKDCATRSTPTCWELFASRASSFRI